MIKCWELFSWMDFLGFLVVFLFVDAEPAPSRRAEKRAEFSGYMNRQLHMQRWTYVGNPDDLPPDLPCGQSYKIRKAGGTEALHRIEKEKLVNE